METSSAPEQLMEPCNSPTSADVPECSKMFQKIISSPSAFFRSQQRSEPDLTEAQKLEILQTIFTNSPRLFLSRYHEFLSREDLAYFREIESVKLKLENDYESEFYLSQIAKKKQPDSRAKNFKRSKNRRFVAMQKLIEDKDFFSDWEMRWREPLLYEQMVGKYQTCEESHRLLHEEGGAHAGNKFSDILLDFCESQEVLKEKERQERVETWMGGFDGKFVSEEEVSEQEKYGNGEKTAEKFGKTLKQMRALNLKRRKDEMVSSSLSSDSEEEDSDSSHDEEVVERKIPHISSEEKEKLRGEFISIMHQRFLSGADKDCFDYDSVDNNPEYDPLDLINQDEEDKYFDSEEPS